MKTSKLAPFFLLLIATFGSAQEIPEARCNESVFKPCICASDVPPEIKYRPKFARCGGKAAVILEDEWADSFSVVLRDRLNRDRYPASGYNGCTLEEASGVAPPARCSAFKCQKTIRRNNRYTCCFGDRGRDRILAKASRMTIKLKDVPGSSADPLARVCLKDFSPRKRLN